MVCLCPDQEIFVEGGNSCTNCFVAGAFIGVKVGVNNIAMNCPVTVIVVN